MRRGAPGSRGLFKGAPPSFIINWSKIFGLTRQKIKWETKNLFIFISYLGWDLVLLNHGTIFIEKGRWDSEKFDNPCSRGSLVASNSSLVVKFAESVPSLEKVVKFCYNLNLN